MDKSRPAEHRLDGQNQRVRITSLLQKYPDVDANDIAEITRFLKEGPIVEVGFLITDEKLSSKVERFRVDHADKLGLSSRDYFIVTIIVAALVLACIFLWDASVT